MADVIHGAEKIRVEIRFHMRLKKFISIHGHLIFIGIQHIRFGMFIHCFGTLKQGVWCQHIVMVCKHQILPGGCLNSCIGIFRNLQRLLMGNYPDSGIFRLVFFQKCRKARILSAAVRQAQLPERIGLSLHRADQFFQKLLRSFVQRYHNAEHRLFFKHGFSLLFQFSRAWQMFLNPFLIIHRLFLVCKKFPVNLCSKGRQSVGTVIVHSLCHIFFCGLS